MQENAGEMGLDLCDISTVKQFGAPVPNFEAQVIGVISYERYEQLVCRYCESTQPGNIQLKPSLAFHGIRQILP